MTIFVVGMNRGVAVGKRVTYTTRHQGNAGTMFLIGVDCIAGRMSIALACEIVSWGVLPDES